MIAATKPDRRSMKLLMVGAERSIGHLSREDLPSLFGSGDVVVANDAATLPASLSGTTASGESIEVRLAGWISPDDVTRFVAILFGAGDHRTPTEERPPPPVPAAGDRLHLGSLAAVVERVLDHPRLVDLRFAAAPEAVLAALARHGRPIQYAHVPEPLALWDVWTAVAGVPVAFEAPSAGYLLDWRTLATWRRRGIGFFTLTHAAGISSTGDPALDARLPFDEPFIIPASTAAAIARCKREGGRVIAVGTTVVRALEAAAAPDGEVRAGRGLARSRIGPGTKLRVVDAVVTGFHQPGESHHELLRAFAEESVLARVNELAELSGYRSHEFGDAVLIER